MSPSRPILAATLGSLLALGGSSARSSDTDGVLVPKVEGPWWQIADNPDLGELSHPKQIPLDFAVWQAADGTWQLWACIYHAQCGGKLRLLFGWEGKRLTDGGWIPQGIMMTADPDLGETPGAVLSPHTFMAGGRYHMTYGDWNHVCMATSRDGKSFDKVVQPNGKTGMFGEGQDAVPRDSYVMRIGETFYCYYGADPDDRGAIYCRTSDDLKTWSPSKIVCSGGRLGAGRCTAQCPFVVWHPNARRYYLFRSGADERTGVYASKDPLDFGITGDRHLVRILPIKAPEIMLHEGQYYVAALIPDRTGIRMAKLTWEKP